VLPSGVGVLRESWQADSFVRHLQAVVRPGDVVVVEPAWWGPLTAYGVGAAAGPTTPLRVPQMADAVAFRIDGAAPTGRAWLAVRSTRPMPFGDDPRCGPTTDDGVFRVTCVELGRAAVAPAG
jgi:hypothetical protein